MPEEGEPDKRMIGKRHITTTAAALKYAIFGLSEAEVQVPMLGWIRWGIALVTRIEL